MSPELVISEFHFLFMGLCSGALQGSNYSSSFSFSWAVGHFSLLLNNCWDLNRWQQQTRAKNPSPRWPTH